MVSTDIVPIEEVRAHMDEGDWARLERLDTAAVDPVVALESVSGMRADTLIYQFPVQGKQVAGLTVRGAKVMASRRGDMEVEAPTISHEMMPVESGETWMDVPAVRATVRVRDLRQNVTFVATVREPTVLLKRDGSQRLNPHADRVAIAKATRNAILDHFAGVTDVVTQFVKDAAAAGKVYVTGDADEAEQVSREVAVQRAKRRAGRNTPIGSIGAGMFTKALKALEAEAVEATGLKEGALVREFNGFLDREWPGLKLAEVPQSDRPRLDAWLADQRKTLGLDDGEPADEEQAPDAAAEEPTAEPEEAPDGDEQPEPEVNEGGERGLEF